MPYFTWREPDSQRKLLGYVGKGYPLFEAINLTSTRGGTITENAFWMELQAQDLTDFAQDVRRAILEQRYRVGDNSLVAEAEQRLYELLYAEKGESDHRVVFNAARLILQTRAPERWPTNAVLLRRAEQAMARGDPERGERASRDIAEQLDFGLISGEWDGSIEPGKEQDPGLQAADGGAAQAADGGSGASP